MDQHTGDANAEVLCNFEKVTDHCTFYQCAEYPVRKRNECQDRDKDTLEIVCCKSGTTGKKYKLGKDSGKYGNL